MRYAFEVEFDQPVWDSLDEDARSEWVDRARRALNAVTYVTADHYVSGNPVLESVVERSWWVDGHFISALSAGDALVYAASAYDFNPESVRPWNDADEGSQSAEDFQRPADAIGALWSLMGDYPFDHGINDSTPIHEGDYLRGATELLIEMGIVRHAVADQRDDAGSDSSDLKQYVKHLLWPDHFADPFNPTEPVVLTPRENALEIAFGTFASNSGDIADKELALQSSNDFEQANVIPAQDFEDWDNISMRASIKELADQITRAILDVADQIEGDHDED